MDEIIEQKILKLPLDKIRITKNNRLDIPEFNKEKYFCSNEDCHNSSWCIYQRLCRDYKAVVPREVFEEIDKNSKKVCTKFDVDNISDFFYYHLNLYDIERWDNTSYEILKERILELYNLCE